MASKPHDLEFLQALFEPVANCGSSKIVELAFFDNRSMQDLTKVRIEARDHL